MYEKLECIFIYYLHKSIETATKFEYLVVVERRIFQFKFGDHIYHTFQDFSKRDGPFFWLNLVSLNFKFDN